MSKWGFSFFYNKLCYSIFTVDLTDLKNKRILDIVMPGEDWGEIFSFIDFGNVNYWFSDDQKDENGDLLNDSDELFVDLEKLAHFSNIFSVSSRFYYGHDPQNERSLGFIRVARGYFGKYRTITKPLQMVRHYLSPEELPCNTRTIKADGRGNYIYIPKCNFDVEICVDAVRLLENFQTICLFSGDADFVHLLRYLKGKGEKIIIVKAGHISHSLAGLADNLVNAQDVKRYFACKKQKSSLATGFADSKPVSTGRCL